MDSNGTLSEDVRILVHVFFKELEMLFDKYETPHSFGCNFKTIY